MKTIILASTSPRRKKLLRQVGLEFKVEASDFKENIKLKLEPRKLARLLSKGKAETVAKRHKNAIIVAADTIVVLQGKILGKPQTKREAIKMLKKLSSKAHLVITGFTIIDTQNNKSLSKTVVTKVFVKKLTNKEINTYVALKEPLDKAGAYAIQGKGAFLIKKIEGDFNNVVGLPIFTLVEALKKFGVNPLI